MSINYALWYSKVAVLWSPKFPNDPKHQKDKIDFGIMIMNVYY